MITYILELYDFPFPCVLLALCDNMARMKRYCHWVALIISVIFVSGCQPPSQLQPPEPMRFALDQIEVTSQRLKKSYQIQPIGYGMKQEFLVLEISFEVRRKISKEEARALLLTCAQEFMDDINANEKLRPYLLEYPFTLSNVGIEFYFRNQDGTFLYDPDLSFAACLPEGFVFSTTDPVKQCGFKEFSTETHEEALALIKESAPPLKLLNAVAP